ncbi:hypothetical protein F2Q69_00027925 [Brassica cretica]|uniref:Uncharacterized protein n=1 Tax=Brassica cretica TaxID=69181 RepID=A0A8S9SCA5_BRACR|nr:hypothetical protein F2Q69_00027925 [Brassica cretica]
MASLGEIEESNDLVNHIRGVFRYFIVDVVDPGSTPDGYHELVFRNKWVSKPPQVVSERMNTPQVVSELRLIDSWSPRLEEERHMKKLPSETEETRKVKEIFGLQEKKKNCWALFAAAEQVYGGRIHESVESIRWWQAASIRKKGFRAVFDLQSQGVCDSHKVFSEGFHGIHGLNLHGISVAGGVLIYVGISARWYSLVSVKGVAEGLKKIDSCGYVFDITHSFLLEWICENEELLVQGRVRLNRHMRGNKWVYKDLLATTAVQSDVQGKVLIQIVTKEILRMRSLLASTSAGNFGEEESIDCSHDRSKCDKPKMTLNRWYSLVSVKGVAEGLKKIDSCGYVFDITHSFLLEWICENEELLVQGRVRLNRWQCQIEIDSGWKHQVVLSGRICWQQQQFRVMFKASGDSGSAGASSSVRESRWRSVVVDNNGAETEEETFTEDDLSMHVMVSRYLKGRQTHIKSKLDLRRWKQRSSISQGLKVFQRSQGMQVIFTKDDQRILQLHRQRKMRRRNQVGQVITTGCNPKEEMQHGQLKGVRAEMKGYSMTRGSWICSECQGQECQDQLTNTRRIIRRFRTMKSEPSMMQDNTWDCRELSYSLSISGRVRLVLHKQAHLKLRGILRQCPQESPLANGQILIDGQVLNRLMADSMTNWRVQVVDGDAHVSVFGDILIQEGELVSRAKAYHGFDGGVSCLSVHQYKVMLKCSLFKNIKVKSKTVPEIWSMSDFKCPQESPLANGQILIDGQVLNRLMADSMTNWRVQVVDGDAHVSVFGDILIQEGELVSRAKAYHGFDGGVSCLSVHQYKVMLKCSLFKNIKVKSKTVPEIWSMSDFKAKEEINLQKDVQVSVQALEQVRDFDSKLGSQLKTLDEGFKNIMKRLQALLKVELREVRRDKRKQGDAEDEQACSSIKKGRHKGRVMDLDQTGGVLLSADNTKKERSRQGSPSSSEPLGGGSFHGGLYTHDRESNDLVNHIKGVFRYFIVDVVDPGSTPDVARCGRELGEQFFSHKQG